MSSKSFWTAERLARARAMRVYRAQITGLDAHVRWSIECMIYSLRGDRLEEGVVGSMVAAALNRSRPWRMSDAELKRAWMRLRQRLIKDSNRKIEGSWRQESRSTKQPLTPK